MLGLLSIAAAAIIMAVLWFIVIVLDQMSRE